MIILLNQLFYQLMRTFSRTFSWLLTAQSTIRASLVSARAGFGFYFSSFDRAFFLLTNRSKVLHNPPPSQDKLSYTQCFSRLPALNWPPQAITVLYMFCNAVFSPTSLISNRMCCAIHNTKVQVLPPPLPRPLLVTLAGSHRVHFLWHPSERLGIASPLAGFRTSGGGSRWQTQHKHVVGAVQGSHVCAQPG